MKITLAPADSALGATPLEIQFLAICRLRAVGLGICVSMLVVPKSLATGGVPLWTNQFIGQTQSSSYPAAIAIDRSGNAFITGASATVAYSPDGQALWTNAYGITFSGAAVTTGAIGNVFVTGSSPNGYETLAYSSVGVALWTNCYHGPGAGATAIAVDGSGNVFVTGSASDTNGTYGYGTVAYAAGGAALWTNWYHGPGNDSDFAGTIAVDALGTVFVTGLSAGGGRNPDYATVAYSTGGVPLWTNRLDGPGNANAWNGSLSLTPSFGVAMVVDTNGNVFVTGSSPGGGGWLGYTTVKYSITGTPIWTNHYHGVGNGNQVANAITVNNKGNVYVTGNWVGVSPPGGYTTVAYSGEGALLWANNYRGPVAELDDVARAIMVDDKGNVFVTGESAGADSYSGNFNYATLAYSSDGLPLWAKRYADPEATDSFLVGIAVDANGNVVVTGASDGGNINFHYSTIAYSANGLPLWTNTYHDPPAPASASATAVAVDKDGNVFVTGRADQHGVTLGGTWTDSATVAYSSAGAPLWTNRFGGPAGFGSSASGIAVDATGNVFVTGWTDTNNQYCYATVAYSSAGTGLWTNVYAGVGNGSLPCAIAVNGAGDIFVTGVVVYGSGSGFGTVAYSGGGVALWTNVFNGAYSNGFAAALAVDTVGDVLVTGTVMTGTNSSGYATLAYSSGGAPLWTNYYSGAGNTYASPIAAAVDTHGNLFVCGTVGNGNLAEYATVAYTRSGAPLWTNVFNGGYANDSAVGLAVDSIGTVFVTGTSTTSTNGSVCYATVAYSNAGIPLWTNWYREPGNNDAPSGIAVDSIGNLFVTGSSTDPSGEVAFATVAYSSDGIPLWTNRSNTQGNGANAIAVDRAGNVIVTGSGSVGTLRNYTTIKYSSSAPAGHLGFGLVGNQMVLRWVDSGLSLQASPVVDGPFTNVPSAGSPYFIPPQGQQQYFRLR